MNAVILGFFGLGLAVLIHVSLVSVTLGVGLIAAIYRYLGYSREDSYYESFARRAFRIMVIFELFSGVWGTIITVFLAGMFPNLLALATNVLFVPILIALISIMVRIPSIAAFWYTWDRISPQKHSLLGFVMALSGFGVPFGFRTIFAEINHPHAVGEFLTSGLATTFLAFANPVFWMLYAHTALAAISVGGFVLLSLMCHEEDRKGAEVAWKFGYYFLLLQIVAGVAYWLTLSSYSPYIYSSVTTGACLPAFALKVLLVLVLLVLGFRARQKIAAGEIPRYAQGIGFVAIAIAFIGELMNSGARYPYMVVTGNQGVPIEAFFNYYLEIPAALVYVILGFLFLSIAIFLAALFYGLLREYLESPEF